MENHNFIQKRFISEYNQAGSIAKFYGFQPINSPEITKTDYDNVKNFDKSLYPEEVSSLMRMYFEEKAYTLSQPVMFWMERPFKGSGEHKKSSKLECTLASLGSPKPITDCLVIRAGLSILQNMEYKDAELRLNSIGDKESSTDFERKMSAFIKKNYNSFPPDLRQAFKKDIFALLRGNNEAWEGLKTQCPKSIDFLSESSRAHFKEVLEFLEIMQVPYSIDHSLVGDPHFCSEIIFSFVSKKTEERMAFGLRANRLAKKIGQKKEIPSVILNISVKPKNTLKKVKTRNINPKFYLIQFGPEAKLKSLIILEELRKIGKHVLHAIAKDKLGSQIGTAESSEIPYILLVGQKEALQNCVLLRNVSTRAQELIPISELALRLKNL